MALLPATWRESRSVLSDSFGQTAAEIAVGVTPVDYGFAPGDVRRYGAVGDGVTDDSTAITTAVSLSGTYKTVFQPASYLTGKVTLPTNASLYLPPGCQLKDSGVLGALDRFLNITNDNILIEAWGASITENNSYGTGEQRHGVFIYGAHNVTVLGLTAENCDGDGFYIGGGAGDPATNVHLKDCIGAANRRNGLSIVNASNFTDENGRWQDQTGTSPSAGIDIEPNVDTDSLENINILRPTCSGNDGAGIGIFLANWDAVSNYADINIDKPFCSGNGQVSISGRYRPGIDINRIPSTTPCSGRIRIVDPICQDEQRAGIHIYDWDINGPRIELIRPTISNPNQANGNSGPVNGGLILYNSTTYTTTPGNVRIEAPLIRDDGALLSGNSLAPIRIDGAWQGIEISDPRYAYSGNPWSIDDDALVRFQTITPIPVTVSTGTTTMTDGRYLGRRINNTGAGSQSTIALIAGHANRIGWRLAFDVTAAQELRIDPNGTEIIRGGTAGQYMTSTTIGDSVTIEMDTATTWKIVERFGTWTFV